MFDIGGSYILGTAVWSAAAIVIYLTMFGLFGPRVHARPAGDGSVSRPALSRLRSMLHRPAVAVRYDWRWSDRVGQVLPGPDGATDAAAVQAGTGVVLLRVYLIEPKVWRISPQGGHLGAQVDGDTWTRTYADPHQAMAAVASRLHLVSVEML